MVEFLYDPTIEEDLNNQPSKLKNSEDLPDLSPPELDDFSSAFADSFLDFDCMKDWIEENPDPYVIEPKPDPDTVDLGKVVFGVVDKRIEMAEDGSCRETSVGDPTGDCSGNLGSLIEEEMGKVKLECPLDGSVVVDGNGVKSERIVGVDGNGVASIEISTGNGNGNGAVSVEIMGFNGNGVKSVETVSVDGNGAKSDEVLGIDGNCARSGEIVRVNGDGPKSGEVVSAVDESDSSSESESESSSSSSSASSSSSEDDDYEEEEEEEEDDEEDVEEEEEKEEEEKGEVEREMDMEEGEIRDSVVEEMVTWSDGEDDEGGEVIKGPIRSKNELKVLPLVPPVNVTLQPYHQTLPVGVVLSIIGSQVIVEGVEKHNPLNEGSILWITEQRSPLGLVDEIFGPVKNPYYMVRYNSDNDVPAGIGQGTLVSFVPEFVNHVLNDNNLYKKGYDASGDNDEPLSDEVEFSDDEKEAEYRRMLKMTKRGMNNQKHENKKKERKKFNNRGGTCRNGQPSTTEVPTGVCQPPVDQHKLYIPPAAAVSVYHDNCRSSSGTGQGLSGPGFVAPFPQLAQAPGFTAPSTGVWINGMPCQPQQSMGFPNSYPTNGMPWLQQSHHQQSYNMPLPNGMPFQQQFDPSQRLPVNAVFPGGHSNFSAGPGFAPWPLSMGQSGYNQLPFGMGLQVHNARPPINVGEQGVPSNGSQERNCDMRPPFVSPGNTQVCQNFNQGAYSGRGRKSYRRGGGRFGGGRGRQQSK
uniref:H/ACA ribonucleoprotein complex non-core subunit NAF1 n=1 Tax=Davidia involucrata TaxID=16924 RepID=A0A5B7BRW9_DAVIN